MLTTDFLVETAIKDDYAELITVWEAAVRATHHFLKEDDIQVIKRLIFEKYFDAVQLHCIAINGRIGAFVGTSDDKIEMLFAHPDFHGQGLEKCLLHFGVQELQKTFVDVNEQNKNATEFYQHSGFRIIGRSEKDGSGKPYPILHLQLIK